MFDPVEVEVRSFAIILERMWGMEMKKGSWGRCAEDRAEWHCKNNHHWQGHHRRKVGVVIRFLWECSFGGERVVRSDNVVGIEVEYFELNRAGRQLRVRE